MSLTKEDLLAISDLLDRRFDPLEERMDRMENRFDGLEQRFDGLEQRFDGLEQRFDGLEGCFDGLETKVDGLTTEVKNLTNRVDHLETEVKAIRHQLDYNIVPRLSNIEACYISTYARYNKMTEKIERYMEKQDILTAVVLEHSQKFKQLGL